MLVVSAADELELLNTLNIRTRTTPPSSSSVVAYPVSSKNSSATLAMSATAEEAVRELK